MAAEFLERMGARIRERREFLELSRAEVARRMPGKVNENQIYRWEKGLHQPNPDTLEALAGVLECDVSFFMAASEKATTPDVFSEAMNRDRLVRIEAKLDRVLAALGEPIDEAEEPDEAVSLPAQPGGVLPPT